MKTWTEEQLIEAAKNSTTYKEIAQKLGLIYFRPYILEKIKELNLDISHIRKKKSLIKSCNNLQEIVNQSVSYAEVLRTLGLSIYGSTHRELKKQIAILNINTDHFVGQAHSKGKISYSDRRRELKDILVENSTYTGSSNLKHRLLKENILEDKCAICGITKWLDIKLSLHLDHINGIHDDNRIENLRLLCPNCHSQTETYAGKNNNKNIIKILNCLECKTLLSRRNKLGYCKLCYNKLFPRKHKTKIEWPSLEQLTTMVWNKPLTHLAKELGVSDVSIAKKCREYNISMPPIGYWIRKT